MRLELRRYSTDKEKIDVVEGSEDNLLSWFVVRWRDDLRRRVGEFSKSQNQCYNFASHLSDGQCATTSEDFGFSESKSEDAPAAGDRNSYCNSSSNIFPPGPGPPALRSLSKDSLGGMTLESYSCDDGICSAQGSTSSSDSRFSEAVAVSSPTPESHGGPQKRHIGVIESDGAAPRLNDYDNPNGNPDPNFTTVRLSAELGADDVKNSTVSAFVDLGTCVTAPFDSEESDLAIAQVSRPISQDSMGGMPPQDSGSDSNTEETQGSKVEMFSENGSKMKVKIVSRNPSQFVTSKQDLVLEATNDTETNNPDARYPAESQSILDTAVSDMDSGTPVGAPPQPENSRIES